MPTVRPPGQGRKSRARQRRLLAESNSALQKAPFLHGNTCQHRWQVLDQWISKLIATGVTHLPFCFPKSGLSIDIGMGDVPTTTIEFAEALGDEWFVIGTECHIDRLEKARAQLEGVANVSAEFSDLSLNISKLIEDRRKDDSFVLVRALNVFRDYALEDACRCIHSIVSQLPVNGILLEGSCNPTGDFFCIMVVDQHATALGVIFGTALADNQHTTDWPTHFGACLPRIWRCYPKLDMPYLRPLANFLSKWKEVTKYQQWVTFTASCDQLASEMSQTPTDNGNVDKTWCSHGVLLWLPPFDVSVPNPLDTRHKTQVA